MVYCLCIRIRIRIHIYIIIWLKFTKSFAFHLLLLLRLFRCLLATRAATQVNKLYDKQFHVFIVFTFCCCCCCRLAAAIEARLKFSLSLRLVRCMTADWHNVRCKFASIAPAWWAIMMLLMIMRIMMMMTTLTLQSHRPSVKHLTALPSALRDDQTAFVPLMTQCAAAHSRQAPFATRNTCGYMYVFVFV